MPAKIGFILKGYPRLSETFIAQEIHLLEERGLELEIFSMRQTRDKDIHPVHKKIRAEVTYIPEDDFFTAPALLEICRTAADFPLGFAGSLIHAIRYSLSRRTLSPLKRLIQASWLIQKKNLGKGSPIRHLHSHFVHAPTEMTFYLSSITGLTYSISAHAKDIYTSSAQEIRERVRGSRFLMTCTHFNFERIREIVGAEHAHKVHEVYHGVNLRAFQGEALQADFPARRLLTVARLVDKKGYDDVFRALVLLKEKGLELRYDIYGSGEEEEALKRLASELGIDEQVRFHGSVTQPVVLDAYKKGGVFVLGSRETGNGDRDGIPNSMAEAMSMELPVVATRVSGIPELVEDGVTGLLVSQREPEELAAAIAKIFQVPGLAGRLGRAARQKVAAVFDADRCIDVCSGLIFPHAGVEK